MTGCLRTARSAGLGALVCLFAGCGGDATGSNPAPDELALSGGATTVFDATSNAFELPAPNLSGESFTRHAAGDAAFDATFVTPPAPVNGGLGPVFNNTSCAACHLSDGRGRPPEPGQPFTSLLVRASLPGAGSQGEPVPVPGLGTQIQPRAVVGVEPEARAEMSYIETVGHFTDGEEYRLRRPVVAVTPTDGSLPGNVLLSPRLAPPVFGLGLLEAVPVQTVLSLADETDADGDGVSGRPNYVWDAIGGARALGRFGWKANSPSLLQQTAAAYNADMGVTSTVFRSETCEGQRPGCAPHDPEVDEETVRLATHYVRTLGVPARRSLVDPVARRGEQLFRSIGCARCHVPELRTGTLSGMPEVSDQVIRPYTDLLLHDMGEGLADGRPDFEASGREWRTPPLWGIGLTLTVSGHTSFLHDGRARSLMEAVLWHGGEAETTSELVRRLRAADRSALIAFLESL
jgi:CxxC motif-containing protein (DUF1111 family)